MSKQEFIDKLRMALSGRVSASLVEENVNYYEEYINTQIRLGQSEASVMAQLGDPRLIAKSIITANNGDAASDTVYSTRQDSSYGGNGYYTEQRESNYPKIVRVPGWVWLVLAVVVLVLIVGIVFSVVSALLPIILPVLLIIFIFKLFKDWLK